ncbi:MAG: ATP-binding cassette subfamily B protein [Chlamydiales bacterium]|jgi:ATP-binding cassette subfamily B protein
MKFIDRISGSARIARRFSPQLAGQRRELWWVAALSLSAISMEILRPWPMQWIMDRALVPTSPQELSVTTIIVIGAIAALTLASVRAVLEYASTLRLTAVGHAVTRKLREHVYRHLSELSPHFHARHKSGDLLVRLMGDVPMLRSMLVDASVLLATRCVLIVFTLAVMLALDPVLTGAALAVVPLLILCVRIFSKQLTVAVRKQRRKEGALADFLDEAISSTSLIQSLGRSEHTVHEFKRGNRRTARAGLKAARATARLQLSVEVLLGASFAVTLGFGSTRVAAGQLSLGELLVFLSYVRTLLKPVRSAAKNWARVAKGAACGERILEVLDNTDVMRDRSGVIPAPEHPAELRFAGVSHRYPDGTLALQGLDLSVRKGELTALLGPSGAGKSTLTGLVLRLFDPTDGQITLDGTDIRELDLNSLRASIGLSMQDTVLFGESVRENLLLGRLDASDEELRTALDAACALEFVEALPNGLDTELGSGGVGLSGGQSKRICLARTLLRNAPILIVDEPFAGLDHQTAEHVLRSLEQQGRDRLVVVVTHDLSTLERFPRVAFLREGRIVAQGSHTELLSSRPDYAEHCRSGTSVT